MFGFAFTLLIKALILPKTLFLIIYSAYVLFALNMIAIAFLTTVFFTSTKRALITGLVNFFLLFIAYLVRDTFRKGGKFDYMLISLSPIGALSQILHLILSVESAFSDFGWSQLGYKVAGYQGWHFF